MSIDWQSLKWWPKNAHDDPILKLASKLGFEVKYYTPPMAPWGKLWKEMNILQLFLCCVVGFLWLNRASTGLVRSFAGVAAILTMVSWPMIYGQCGLGILDFGIPAYAFLSTLHFTDIFLVRDADDTRDWSYRKMYAELLTFPKEEQSDHPRWENFKVLGLCLFKYLVVNLLLYAAPNEQIIQTVHSPLAYIGYHAVIGACVLYTLGFFIEGSMRLFGIILGVEQDYLFHNPLFAPNLRLFWSRWNMVIHDGLHRVVFHRKKQKEKQQKQEKAQQNGPVAKKQKGPLNGKRFSHKDYLSETDAGHDSGPSEEEKRRAAAVANRKQQRKRSRFLPKAAAAFATFTFSGLFHEYMNHIAFGGASGENLAFFCSHALLVIAYVYIQRNYPSIPKSVPTPLAILGVNTIVFLTSPLFCRPFVRASYFDQFKNGGLIAGPVRGWVAVFGR